MPDSLPPKSSRSLLCGLPCRIHCLNNIQPAFQLPPISIARNFVFLFQFVVKAQSTIQESKHKEFDNQ
jgi:hypothetical protein